MDDWLKYILVMIGYMIGKLYPMGGGKWISQLADRTSLEATVRRVRGLKKAWVASKSQTDRDWKHAREKLEEVNIERTRSLWELQTEAVLDFLPCL